MVRGFQESHHPMTQECGFSKMIKLHFYRFANIVLQTKRDCRGKWQSLLNHFKTMGAPEEAEAVSDASAAHSLCLMLHTLLRAVKSRLFSFS
jgi:hypothetical protein